MLGRQRVEWAEFSFSSFFFCSGFQHSYISNYRRQESGLQQLLIKYNSSTFLPKHGDLAVLNP